MTAMSFDPSRLADAILSTGTPIDLADDHSVELAILAVADVATVDAYLVDCVGEALRALRARSLEFQAEEIA